MTQQPKSSNIFWHEGNVSRQERTEALGQTGLTLWFTGLSGSGKSTLAVALEQHLLHSHKYAYRLDGDNIRFGLNKDLGFSPQDRTENIRRIGEVCKLFADSGAICLASFISPYAQDRDMARKLHQEANIPFIEVFADCPIPVLAERDPKGLYKKALAGEIKHFTGVSPDAPYEVPTNPELHIKTDGCTIEQGVQQILDYLQQHNLVELK